jgi:hypothetical protein
MRDWTASSVRHPVGIGHRREAPMDFSAQLEKLQQQATEAVASIRAASAESRDQLKQRIDEARVDGNLALMDAKQRLSRRPIEPRASGRR